MDAPGPADWLATHQEEGQKYGDWLLGDPVMPDAKRDVLYIRTLGAFSEEEKEVIRVAIGFVREFYAPIEVKYLASHPLEDLPEDAFREDSFQGRQLLTTHLMYGILLPKLPADAVCVIGLTAEDLYAGAGWNYVFGQASTRNRVGVWSIARFGDPVEEREQCIRRCIKTAVHEIGHMFTMRHCIEFQCGMSGSNHLQEADRRPVAFCPECVSKVWSLKGVNPVNRYQRLEAYCRKNGLGKPAAHYLALFHALGGE